MFGVDDPGTLEAVRAYVKLLRAARSVAARVEPGLADSCLTLTQFGALEALLHLGPIGQRALGQKVLTSAGNLTDVIDKLERRGLVERQRDPVDRRGVIVALTAKGRDLIEALFPIHAGDIAAAMGGLDRAELATLGALLRRLGRHSA